MDYSKFFSEDVGSFMRSPVREIFKKVDLASIYSFAGGYPDAATFPLDDIRRISAQVLDRYGAKALQYGATQGVPELREVIARRYGVAVENVQVTTSSQQGIDVCTRVFANPGDVILTTSPTYLGMRKIRNRHIQVPGDDLVDRPDNFFDLFRRGSFRQKIVAFGFLPFDVCIARTGAAEKPDHRGVQNVLTGMHRRIFFLVVGIDDRFFHKLIFREHAP